MTGVGAFSGYDRQVVNVGLDRFISELGALRPELTGAAGVVTLLGVTGLENDPERFRRGTLVDTEDEEEATVVGGRGSPGVTGPVAVAAPCCVTGVGKEGRILLDKEGSCGTEGEEGGRMDMGGEGNRGAVDPGPVRAVPKGKGLAILDSSGPKDRRSPKELSGILPLGAVAGETVTVSSVVLMFTVSNPFVQLTLSPFSFPLLSLSDGTV